MGYQSIYLEETPFQNADGSINFENVKVDFRNGTNDQEYIEGFPAVENETPDRRGVKVMKHLGFELLTILILMLFVYA